MSVAFDGAERLGQLTVWATGEAESERAEVATGQVHREHHDLASLADLDRLLDVLLRWQRAEGEGGG